MNTQADEDLRSVPASEARSLLQEQRESDVSLAAFARSKGVKPWSLYNAKALERRRARRDSGARFAEVRVIDKPTSTENASAAIELALPSGIAIRVQRDFDEIALRRLLGVLGSC